MKDMKFEEVPACSGKLAFDTKAEAQSMATTVAYQRGSRLKTYKCRDCKLWHLTSDYSRR